jgi:YidC/Oxa1 family membrane protein insertase
MNRQQDNPNNIFIAIVLSMAVLLGWQVFIAGPRMEAERAKQRQAQEQAAATAPKPGEAPAAVPAGGSAPAVPGAGTTATPQDGAPGATSAPTVPAAAQPAATREAALQGGARVPIATPSLAGSINLKGGRIDDLTLTRYHVTADPKSANVVLFSPANAPEPYFAEHGWVAGAGTSQRMPDRETLWRAEGAAKLTPESPVTLVFDNGQGLVFRRTISLDASYMFKIADEVRNTSNAPALLHPYARIYRYGTPKTEGFYIQHEGLIGFVGDNRLQELTYADVLKEGGGKEWTDVKTGWLGLVDKYWSAAIVPDQTASYKAKLDCIRPERAAPCTKLAGKDQFQADYLRGAVAIPAGGATTVEAMLFAGAKQVHLINEYEAKHQIREFNYLIDWGWFYFITKPLFQLLSWLYGHLGNFGLAILAVTVIVKAAFFPLANKSYESMARMKKLQPQMEQLRERFKDDKARQQQELMALYQKEKINPLAGCLPILLQIPVFFALYKVLFVALDMRHAPFYGWIKDLSAPDPTSLFNLFGLLPFAVPEFLHIGAWPVIMGLTMWLQMQLNPKQPDPTQQMIFNWMPVLFTFLLASFPAGLVIYWAWNNVLSLAQQWFIMRKQGTEVPIAQNIKATFEPIVNLVRGKGSGGDGSKR